MYLDPLTDIPLADILRALVERCRDAIPATRHRGLVAAEYLGELIAYLEHEVRRLDRRDRRLGDLAGLGTRGVGLYLRDGAGVDHLIEDVETTFLSAVGVLRLRRVEDRGGLRQTGAEGGLSQ